MRGVGAVILCLVAALALPGRMRRSAPVVQPRSDLDTMADTVFVGERRF